MGPAFDLTSSTPRYQFASTLRDADVHSNERADNVIHENHRFSTLVDRIDERVPITPANYAEITVEDVHEAFRYVHSDGTWDATSCASNENALASNTIRYRQKPRFGPVRLEILRNYLSDSEYNR